MTAWEPRRRRVTRSINPRLQALRALAAAPPTAVAARPIAGPVPSQAYLERISAAYAALPRSDR